MKDLHGLSTVSESRESIADSAFAEMDNDGDGVVTWWVLMIIIIVNIILIITRKSSLR